MNTQPDHPAEIEQQAALELAQLREQAQQSRTLLIGLQEDLLAAHARLSQAHAAWSDAGPALRHAASAPAAGVMAHERQSGTQQWTSSSEPLREQLIQALAQARGRSAQVAMIVVEATDAQGAWVDEPVMAEAMRCLASVLRAADAVSHHVGDSSLVLLAEVAQAADAALIANKIRSTLFGAEAFNVRGRGLVVRLGISLYPQDGADAATLYDRACVSLHGAERDQHATMAIPGEQPVVPLQDRQTPAWRAAPVRQLAPVDAAVTEHERRHLQLREANEQLVLAALSAQELQAAAEQAQRRQMEFLAVLAHELRDPLAPLSNVAAMLGRVHTDEPLLLRLQAVIVRQVQHMTRLVSDLLDVSRVSTGKLRLACRVVDLVGVLEDAVDTCQAALSARQQHLITHLPQRPLEVEGDPIRLAQVFSNLLGNASKYTPDSGQIELSILESDAAIAITVSDNGIGITAATLPHVFEPFRQDTQAAGFNGEGLGIGLTVVRELVQAHGGHVIAQSAGSGLGSRFVVTLPRSGRRLVA